MPATWSGNWAAKLLDVQAAERVAGQHVRPGNVGTFEQGVEVCGDVGAVLGAVDWVAPAAAGAVINADCCVAGHGRRNPPEV